MRLLLDTPAFWWAVNGPEQLSDWARGAIADESNEIHVSVVSWWELIAKRNRGVVAFPNPEAFLPDVTRRIGVESVLEIRASHVLDLERLPALHRDPFDRMLVAQARMEKLMLVTADRLVQSYPVSWGW